ncbi:hypothetical protein P8452_47130 [Trifolium repens]|nr:hypothetical protein P8452_47130 [Trifolium repens]
MGLDGDESIQMMLIEVEDITGNSFADNMNFSDEIGEILVEERSTSSAWRVISQKLVNSCKDVCKKKGSLRFNCKHVESEMGLHKWDLRNGKSDTHFTSLDKFCGSPVSVSIPDTIYADNDLKGFYELSEKWLEQYRFGLDSEFVQELLEMNLVDNGFLVVEYKGQSKYQDEEDAVQGLLLQNSLVTFVRFGSF